MGYPEINLAHLRTITDCTGVIQHAVHSVPNRKLGYTTDDNGRALIVAAKQYERTNAREDLDLAIVYLSYLHHVQNSDHNFRNLMKSKVAEFARRFKEEHALDLVFSDEAVDLLVELSTTQDKTMRTIFSEKFRDFQHGLKLISKNTGRTAFEITRAIVEAPDRELSRWVVESFQPGR